MNKQMNKRAGCLGNWLDVSQAERGWGDFENNDYVKDDKDEPRQGQQH